MSSLCPSYHGMARSAVAEAGMASNMEGSCEYIEYFVVDSQERVRGLGEIRRSVQRQSLPCY